MDSLTSLLEGFGTALTPTNLMFALLGVLLGTAKYLNETLQPFIRHTGPSLSPVNAWILLKGLETLELRLQRSCEVAEKVAMLDHLSGGRFELGMGRSVTRRARARFPDEPVDGLRTGWYAFMRAHRNRSLRRPPPRVTPGTPVP